MAQLTCVYLLAVAACTFMVDPSYGQPVDSDLALQRLDLETRIVIDGQKEPSLVPYSIRMKIFFYRYKRYGKGYQVEMRNLLSENDEGILSEYADRHQQAIASDESLREVKYHQVLSGAESLSGLEIANAFESIYQEYQSQAEGRYRAVLNQLSPDGRKVVEDFAFARVRPVMSLENQVAIATAAPEFFKQRVLDKRGSKLAAGQRPSSSEAAPNQSNVQSTSGSDIRFSSN